MPIKDIKFAQLNLARSQLATNELVLFANKEKLDILVLQEPYAVSNSSTRPSSTAKLVTANGPDEYPWPAIMIINQNLRATNIRQTGCEFLAVAPIKNGQEEFYAATVI